MMGTLGQWETDVSWQSSRSLFRHAKNFACYEKLMEICHMTEEKWKPVCATVVDTIIKTNISTVYNLKAFIFRKCLH